MPYQGEIEAVEEWFRRRGLPAVVRRRPTQLLVRIAPAVLFILASNAILTVLSVMDGQTEADFDRRIQNPYFAMTYTGLLIGLLVLPGIGAWMTRRWARRKILEHGGRVAAATMATATVALTPILDHATSVTMIVTGVVKQLVTLAVLVVAALLGLGSISGWALRTAFRQTRLLGELTSRALPLLLLFTVFGFLTAEIWQLGALLTRGRMWLVVVLFAVVAVTFLLAVLKDEVASLTRSAPTPTGLGKLQQTPLAPLLADGVIDDRQPLTRRERANMVLVLLLAQALQTFVLATLIFAFFVAFGLIAVEDATIKAWTNRNPSGGTLFGVQLPLPHELLQVSLFIAAFTGLYFAAAAVTDAKYRKAFFDPLTEHLEASLVARDVYLAARARAANDGERPAFPTLPVSAPRDAGAGDGRPGPGTRSPLRPDVGPATRHLSEGHSTGSGHRSDHT